MGEVTSLILDGILCYRCGSFVSDQIVEHPTLCEECSEDGENDLE